MSAGCAPGSAAVRGLAVQSRRVTARIGAGRAKPSAIAHDGRPGNIDIPSGGIDIGRRKAVVAEAGGATGIMFTNCDTATGLLQLNPPSLDLTIQMLPSVARRVAPSQKTYTVPSGPTTGREP
jgi:hypothetical protein